MPTADDLFPIIVYCLVGANPAYLEANVNFVSAYLGPKKRLNREGFVLTNLVAAIAFLKKLDGTALLDGEVKLMEEPRKSKIGSFAKLKEKHRAEQHKNKEEIPQPPDQEKTSLDGGQKNITEKSVTEGKDD